MAADSRRAGGCPAPVGGSVQGTSRLRRAAQCMQDHAHTGVQQLHRERSWYCMSIKL